MKKETIFKFVFITVFVILMNLLFDKNLGSVGYVMQLVFIFGLILSLLGSWKNHKKIITLFATAVFFISLVSITRTNNFVQFIYGLSSILLAIYCMYLLLQKKGQFSTLSELFFSPFLVATYYITGIWKALNSEKKIPFQPLIRIIIALIIGLLLALLFASADPIYNKFLNNVLNLGNGQVLNRIVWSLFLFACAIPLLYFKRKQIYSFSLHKLYPRLYLNTALFTNVVIIVVIASFLIIQWPYIFVNVAFETKLSQFGVATYSEYVRKGFIEFIFISIVLYALLWLGLITYRLQKEGVDKKRLLFSQIVIIGEFIILLLSLFRRIYLYQMYHGWSLLRIYGGSVLIVVGFMTFFLLLRHFFRKSFVRWELLIGMCFIVFIGVFNAEQFIIQTHPPTVNNRIDYIYLSQLSPDGSTGWIQSYNHVKSLLFDDALLQKQVLNKTDRQNIAYSGIIMTNLINRFDQLIKQYGSPEEIKQYYLTLTDRLITIYKNRLNRIDIHPVNRKENEKDYKRLIQFKKDLQTQPITKLYFETISLSGYSYSIQFDKSVANYFDSFYVTYEQPEELKKLYENVLLQSSWDQLLVFNYSDSQSYRLFTHTMTLNSFLDMEKRFFILFNKVVSQPDNEKSYEVDTTFDTNLD